MQGHTGLMQEAHFDTAYDRPILPSTLVAFHNMQSYPEFLIRFTDTRFVFN
jgi:hypothetical protein